MARINNFVIFFVHIYIEIEDFYMISTICRQFTWRGHNSSIWNLNTFNYSYHELVSDFHTHLSKAIYVFLVYYSLHIWTLYYCLLLTIVLKVLERVMVTLKRLFIANALIKVNGVSIIKQFYVKNSYWL